MEKPLEIRPSRAANSHFRFLLANFLSLPLLFSILQVDVISKKGLLIFLKISGALGVGQILLVRCALTPVRTGHGILTIEELFSPTRILVRVDICMFCMTLHYAVAAAAAAAVTVSPHI